MMRHPQAHEWAALDAGTIGGAARERLEAHAASCEACRTARAHVVSVRRALGAIAESAPPPIHWERLGARIHWSVSSEIRRRERVQEERRGWSRRLLPLALGGAAVAAGVIAVVIAVRHGRHHEQKAETPIGDPKSIPPLKHEPPKLNPDVNQDPGAVIVPSLDGVVTFAQGNATVNDQAVALATTSLTKGSTIVTGDGRLAVQFGERSGFVLEPHSKLEITAFDEGAVDLQVDQGAVAVEVTHRQPKQRFTVSAGSRRVEVRGTIFRVARTAGAVDVVCTRGRVAVIDGADEVAVPAGDRLTIADALRIVDGHVQTMADPELQKMGAELHIAMVAGWTSAGEVRARSATLTIAESRGMVRLDDVEVGQGSFAIRVAPGRHQITANGASRWIELDAGATMAAPAITPTTTSHERAGQYHRQLLAHQEQINACIRDRVKQQPDYQATMSVTLDIDATGSIGSMNASHLDDQSIENCVRDVIESFTFPPGTAETVAQTIVLTAPH
jgi:ferric-dicitrate binding protein FerR (iron transport regulator)